jgi:HEAT repeat protein
MRLCFAVIAVVCTPLFSIDPSAVEQVKLSLSLHDTRGAHALLEQIQTQSEDLKTDPALLCLLFDYLAEIKDAEGMKALWEKTKSVESLDNATAERIAWINIETASRSYHPKLRAEALFAAAGSQDVHGVHILTYMLDDEHQGIQQMALELACHYPDASVQQQAKKIARGALPETRVAAAALLAVQKAPCAKDVLHSMLFDDTLSAEDHVIIASFLAQLSDRVDLAWLQNAVKDTHPSLRALAATSVRTHPTAEGLRLLIPLLDDSSTAVRRCVFETFGLWQSLIPESRDLLIAAWSQGLQSPASVIAATSAWGLLLSSDEKSKQEASKWFEQAIQTGTKEQELTACSRLIKTGSNGLTLAAKLLKTIKEPLPKLNLASYLLLNRTNVSEAAEGLRTALPSALVADESSGIFEWIGTYSKPHHPGIPRLPESEDLLIRLQLAALRRYAGEPVSREEVEKMLNDRAWGVCAATSIFVFQEFASSLNEVLNPLLSHETESIRIQAALLLTIVSPSKTAAAILAEQYALASREGKEALILGFSCLPLSQTKPYLIPLLFDSSPAIRTRASGALIASMYK